MIQKIQFLYKYILLFWLLPLISLSLFLVMVKVSFDLKVGFSSSANKRNYRGKLKKLTKN